MAREAAGRQGVSGSDCTEYALGFALALAAGVDRSAPRFIMQKTGGSVMRFKTDDGGFDFTPNRAIVAGWTGRDAAAVQHHIDELAEIGVPGPSSYPLYYRVSAATVTQADHIEALGDASSGEVEAVVIKRDGVLWLTVGSDHTDRALEAYSVAHSKQICSKPIGAEAWRMDSVADLDQLHLKAWIIENGEEIPYMDGSMAAVRAISELMAGAELADGEIMFCGALPAIGGVRPSDHFRMEMTDPATGRTISHTYGVTHLPTIS